MTPAMSSHRNDSTTQDDEIGDEHGQADHNNHDGPRTVPCFGNMGAR